MDPTVTYELWVVTYGRSEFEVVVRRPDGLVWRADFPLDWAIGEEWTWIEELIVDAELGLTQVRVLTDVHAAQKGC